MSLSLILVIILLEREQRSRAPRLFLVPFWQFEIIDNRAGVVFVAFRKIEPKYTVRDAKNKY